MPWYKIEAWCGPGHQSHDVNYEWSPTHLTTAGKKERLDDYYEGRDAAMCKVTLVKKLPAQEHRSRLIACQNSIAWNQELLRVLVNTKAETKYRGYTVTYYRPADQSKVLFGVSRRGKSVFPSDITFGYEVDALEAIDMFIKAGRNIEKFRADRDRRRAIMEEVRRKDLELYGKKV